MMQRYKFPQISSMILKIILLTKIIRNFILDESDKTEENLVEVSPCLGIPTF